MPNVIQRTEMEKEKPVKLAKNRKEHMGKQYEQPVLFAENEMGPESEQKIMKETASRSKLSRKACLSGFGKSRSPYDMGFDPDVYHTVPPDPEDNEEIGYSPSFNIDKEYAIPDECVPGELRIPDCIMGEALLMKTEKPVKVVKDPTPSTDSKKENSKTRHESLRYNRYRRKNGNGGVA